METFLNLVWLVVAAAAIWQWRFRWTVSRRTPRHSRRLEAGAMVCALALLFPVISLTDDLHPEIVAVDAASGKRNAGLILAAATIRHAGPTPLATHSTLGLLSSGFSSIQFAATQIFHFDPIRDPLASSRNSLGRSPPLSL
jgi:hypothetical protein